MVASKELEVAEYNALAAAEEKKAIIAIAEGKEKAITLSGAITEKEKTLANIEADARVKIAESLKDIKTPSLVITGGSGEGGNGYMGSMVNLAVMKAAGVLPQDFSVANTATKTVTK